MSTKKKSLGASMRAGREQARRLQHQDPRAAMNESATGNGAREELVKVRDMAQGELLNRAYALSALRALIWGLEFQESHGDADMLREARSVKEALINREEAEFAPLRQQVRDGKLNVDWWRQQVAPLLPYGRDAFTERLFGLYDAPSAARGRESEMVHLVPSPVDQILEVASMIGADDVFCDLGCGLGQVSLLIHWVTGVSALGVEYEPRYVQMAQKANEALGFDVAFINGDARDFDYGRANFFYMYEPFRGELMLDVLSKIRDRAKETSVAIAARFATGNPLAEQDWLKEEFRGPGGTVLYRPRCVSSAAE